MSKRIIEVVAEKKEDTKIVAESVDESIDDVNFKKSKKKKKVKKPAKVLTKKQNIIIMCSVSVLGVASGGGIGGYIIKAQQSGVRVLEDTSKYLDSLDTIQTNYYKWLVANDPSLISEYQDNEAVKNFYNSSVKKGNVDTDISSYLSITDILQISFYNLENNVEEYVTESIGSMKTSPGVGTQYLTSVHGRKGNIYYFENDSVSSVVNFGIRFVLNEDGNISYYRADTKNLTQTGSNGKEIIQCTFPSEPIQHMTDDEYKTLYGASIKDPCIYLISSKTYSKKYESSITTLDDGSGYEISITFTKKACQDYITQIINSSDGKVKNVTGFAYSTWVVRLDNNLLPTWRSLSEMYTTFSLGMNVTCSSFIEETFYYDNVYFPNTDEKYPVRLLQ